MPSEFLPFWAEIGILLLAIGLLIGCISLWQSKTRLRRAGSAELSPPEDTAPQPEKNFTKDSLGLQQRCLELEEHDALQTKIFSVISHDLRSPITSVIGLLNLIGEGTLTPEEAKPYAIKARGRVQTTLEMITNLLHWARNRMHGSTYTPQEADLMRITEKQVQVYAPIAEEKGVKVVNQIEAKALCFVDTDMLIIVLRNLISNAIKYTKSGGTVTIDHEVCQDYFLVKVRDSGIGMDDATREKLFCTTVDSQRGTNQEKGTGLGLQLCKEFVEISGGEIGVTSQPGEGSEFYFTMPIHKQAQQSQPVHAISA